MAKRRDSSTHSYTQAQVYTLIASVLETVSQQLQDYPVAYVLEDLKHSAKECRIVAQKKSTSY